MDSYREAVLAAVDLGATGIKAGLFALDGTLVSSASRRNGPVPQPNGEDGWLIWDAGYIWDMVCECLREAIGAIASPDQIAGVSVSGFGVDGAPLDRDGTLLYPLSSWHDTRNIPETEWLSQQISPFEFYSITGFHNYNMQTVNRLRWLAVHEPAILKHTHKYLMTQDFLVNRLTGEFSTEITMASTTAMLDIGAADWSGRILDTIEVDRSLFPEISQSGRNIGKVTAEAAARTGIPAGTPVATGGHDCEIGTLGAGITDPGTYVDITGTWEMVISVQNTFSPDRELFEHGIDWERHCLPGQFLCQSLMVAGGVVEWVANSLYADVTDDSLYPTMIGEARQTEPGAGGVVVLPAFVHGAGPFRSQASLGSILGLTTTTSRGQVFRAVLESTCYQLAHQVRSIENNTGTMCRRLRSLGGVQKNEFWLQMKADVTGLPVEVEENPEVTLLGAAILAGIGAGLYTNERDALSRMKFPTVVYEPDADRHDRYRAWYDRVFVHMAPALEPVFRSMDDMR